MSIQSEFHRYLNVRASTGGTLRRDQRRLAFLNNATGVAQVWTLDGPGLWPQQRTFYPNRITFVRYSPTSNDLIFGMDEGGNEQDQLYLMDDEGMSVRPLTAMPEAKHVWGSWSPDGQQIAFTGTRDDPAEFYPYVIDLVSGETRCVAQLPGYDTVSAWMPDDKALVLARYTSNANSDLFHLDLSTGEVRHLTPHEGDILYTVVQPLPNGSGLLLLTDLGHDFLSLACYNFITRKLELLDQSLWDQEELALTPDGRWLAVLSNENGYGVLEIRDLVNQRREAVKGLP